jgi:hypothetical protein
MPPARAPVAGRRLIVAALLVLVAILLPLLVGRPAAAVEPARVGLYVVDWQAIADSPGTLSEEKISDALAKTGQNTIVVQITAGGTDPCATDPHAAERRHAVLCDRLAKLKAITVSPDELLRNGGKFPTGVHIGTGGSVPANLAMKSLVGILVSAPLLLIAGWLVSRARPMASAQVPSAQVPSAQVPYVQPVAVGPPQPVRPAAGKSRVPARSVAALFPAQPGDRVETVTHFRPAGGYVRSGSATVWAYSPAGLPFRPGEQLVVSGWDRAGAGLLVEPARR